MKSVRDGGEDVLLAVNPLQEFFAHLLFDFGVCRIVNQVRALGRILFQVVKEIVRVCVGGTGGVSVYTGGIDRIEYSGVRMQRPQRLSLICAKTSFSRSRSG